MPRDAGIYSRIPASNWRDWREKFSKSLPPQVTLSYLKSLLSLTSDGAANNLIPQFKRVGLIHDDGRPTDRAIRWRADDSYDDVCQEIIEQVYPAELISLHSGPDIDKVKCFSWFHSQGLGQSAATQTSAFYILLNTPLSHEADVEASDNPSLPRRTANRSSDSYFS